MAARIWALPAAPPLFSLPLLPAAAPGQHISVLRITHATPTQVVVLTAFLLTVDQVVNAGGFEALLVDTGVRPACSPNIPALQPSPTLKPAHVLHCCCRVLRQPCTPLALPSLLQRGVW